jgi:signal transduction histidine kinase
MNDVALEHVLINLILNAIQHIPDHRRQGGKVTIKVRSLVGQETLPVQIQVTDNGSGIHRQWWERIFDLGFSTRVNGSGLGLFVSRSFVESYGGKLYIQESTMMVGSTFLIALPSAARSG